MSDRLSTLETAIKEIFEHKITFNEFLGFQVDSLTDAEVVISFKMRPELVGHYLYGRLHGGVISSVLDATGGLAVMWGLVLYHHSESVDETLQRFAHLGTIDLRIDYLRQGIGDQFYASATVSRLGRRIATTQMRLTNNEGTEIASGTATYIVQA